MLTYYIKLCKIIAQMILCINCYVFCENERLCFFTILNPYQHFSALCDERLYIMLIRPIGFN